jgi:uncharacterized membrane protein YgcG
VGEAKCPFCLAALPRDFGSVFLAPPPPPGLTRLEAALYGARWGVSGAIATAAAAVMSCSTGTSVPTGEVGVAPFGACSTADTYATTTRFQADFLCPGVHCDGPAPVALCNGFQWFACDCQIPSGWQKVEVSFYSSYSSYGSPGTSGGYSSSTSGDSSTSGGSTSGGSTGGGSSTSGGSTGGD